MRMYSRGLYVALLIALLASSAEAASQRVVLLQSAERGNLVLDRFTALLRVRLGEHAAEPLTLTEFVVNPSGFSDPPELAMVAFLRSAFAGRSKPDLVITTGGAAAAFFQRHRAQLFPDSPILYASLDQRWINGFTERETAVAVAQDPKGSVTEILRLLPSTENVFVVVGGGPLGRFWRKVLDQESSQFHDRLRFIWPDGMSYAAMLQQASTLPARSVIFFTSTFEVDAESVTYSTERVLDDLHARANAPIFGMQSVELGHGAVGGRLNDIEALSRTTADVAFRILGGTSPALIQARIQQPGPPVFDWRELQRWGISEDRLPTGSVALFRERSLWQRYKWTAAGTASVLGVEALLIVALLVNRAKRSRAERALLDANARLSDLSGHLMEAQERERRHIARELHDDIAQRLAIVAVSLEQPGLHGSPADFAQQVTGIAQDLQSLSHRLHSSKLEYLGIVPATAAFCRETSNQYSMPIAFEHCGTLDGLSPDAALALFRVLQEGVSNAIRHAKTDRISVSLRGVKNGVELVVADYGFGFDVAQARQGCGLGLISMEERMKLIGGDFQVRSDAAGTVVRAFAPFTGAPDSTAADSAITEFAGETTSVPGRRSTNGLVA